MPVITSIEKQKRRRRVDVHVDGVYALSLSLDVAVESRLAVGAELSPILRKQIEAEDQRRGAIEASLRMLSMHARSRQELSDRLKRRGFRAAAREAALTRMSELGYLNDEAFARLVVESRQASTPRSQRALVFELSRKGVDPELAMAAVATVSDADAAYDAAQRRLRGLRSLDHQTFTRRLGSFLASRGFSYGIASNAIERCWRELAEERAAAQEHTSEA